MAPARTLPSVLNPAAGPVGVERTQDAVRRHRRTTVHSSGCVWIHMSSAFRIRSHKIRMQHG